MFRIDQFSTTVDTGTEEVGAWARRRRRELDGGRLSKITAALRTAARDAKTEEAAAEARRCIGYLFRNRRRMRYPRFRAQGLCVASGVVEAGCKRVVGDRLKLAGMRWTLAGADAVIAPAMLPAQRAIRGLLGAASRLSRGLTNLTAQVPRIP